MGVSVSVQVSKQCHKPPEPPKTRRWGRGKRAQSEPKVKNAESDTVTVEEAVQNVSLESGREGDGNRG